MIKGIDISTFQKNVDWNKVKNAGFEFAILRASYGKNEKDDLFESHYTGAKAAGLKVGAYHFFYARNIEEAKLDAQNFLRCIAGKQFEYPVILDAESSSYQGTIDKKTMTDMCITFLEIMKNAGYFTGIYANIDWFKNRLDDSRLAPYMHWIAQYNSVCSYTGSHGMWQKSSSGQVPGISGNVDIDECYVDYPAMIIGAGLNGFSNQTPVQPVTPPAPAPEPETETTYTVKSGDTLSSIASKYSTTYQHLAQINGIADPNKIYPGQVLKV